MINAVETAVKQANTKLLAETKKIYGATWGQVMIVITDKEYMAYLGDISQLWTFITVALIYLRQLIAGIFKRRGIVLVAMPLLLW